jgi:hypothetical protein
MNTSLDIWKEKLEFLRIQEATVTDPDQKFAIEKKIKEAQIKIKEMEREMSAGANLDAEPRAASMLTWVDLVLNSST